VPGPVTRLHIILAWVRVLSIGNMYPPHHLGGYELMWQSSVRHLRRSGHEVRVLCTDHRARYADPSTPDEPDVHRELHWYWRDHRFPRTGLWRRLALERHNAAVLDRLLREFSPQVVNWWAMGGMSLSLIERVRRAGLPAVGVVVDEWMLYGPKVDAWSRIFARRPRLATVAERLTGIPTRPDLGGAGTWIFASETIRDNALANGRALPQAQVAYPGADLNLFRPAPALAWRWRLLYCGRIDPRKGIRLAVEALALLPPAATLTIVGSGDESHLEELRSLVATKSLGARVSFRLEPRAHLPHMYAQADAVLFPVLWTEPWGLVPLEAMAVGTPVIASGRGGSGEYLRDRENCLLFDPDQGPEALARAVAQLAEDESLGARLREAGFETASGFSEESFNEAVEAAIERAAVASTKVAPSSR
jgi:glycosyltransferase involved in cell wall biosynthesis